MKRNFEIKWIVTADLHLIMIQLSCSLTIAHNEYLRAILRAGLLFSQFGHT